LPPSPEGGKEFCLKFVYTYQEGEEIVIGKFFSYTHLGDGGHKKAHPINQMSF